jgi:hypothetical protein
MLVKLTISGAFIWKYSFCLLLLLHQESVPLISGAYLKSFIALENLKVDPDANAK